MHCDPKITTCPDTPWNREDWEKFANSYSDQVQNRVSETADSFIAVGTKSRSDCIQSPPSFAQNWSPGSLRSMAVDLCTAREFIGALVSGIWHGVTTFGPRLDEISTRLYSKDPAVRATAVGDLLFIDIEIAGGLEMVGGMTSLVKGRFTPTKVPSQISFPGSGVRGFSSNGSISAVFTPELSVEGVLISTVPVAGEVTQSLASICLFFGDGAGGTSSAGEPEKPAPFSMGNLTLEEAAEMFSRVAGKEVTVETLKKALKRTLQLPTGRRRMSWSDDLEWRFKKLEWDGEGLSGEAIVGNREVPFKVRFSNARRLRPGSTDPNDLVDTVGVEMLTRSEGRWTTGRKGPDDMVSPEDLDPKEPSGSKLGIENIGRGRANRQHWGRRR